MGFAKLSDFTKVPKFESHNHLNLGMQYAKWSAWSGFLIPDFPRRLSGLDEMHEKIIIPYTRPRVKNYQDVVDVMTLAIESAIEDNIKVLEGSIDLQFVGQCGGIDQFIQMVDHLVSKFKNQIDFRPELGVGKTFDKEKVKEWLEPVLKSERFKSIDLYGPEVFDDLEIFDHYYNLAETLGMKKKAHVGEFSAPETIRSMIQTLGLDEVQHGITSVKDWEIMHFLKENRIKCNVCPESNVILGAHPNLKSHPVRQMLEAGIKVSINTDDLLLFNKTISQQCFEMVLEGLFTKKEMIEVLEGAF